MAGTAQKSILVSLDEDSLQRFLDEGQILVPMAGDGDRLVVLQYNEGIETPERQDLKGVA